MISEALQFLSPDPAEDAWENRFQPTEVPCTCQRGWVEDETGWYRCVTPDCDQGDLIFELCQKCQKDQNECFCSVEDFREGR